MFLICGAKSYTVTPTRLPPLVSERAREVADRPDPLIKYSQMVSADPYHPDTNKQGYIDLGLAENRLCQDITTEKLRSLDLTKEAESLLQYYPNLKGLPSFRHALAGFIERRFRPREKIDPEKLIVASGTTALLDTLAFSLAEPGEYIMVPAPYYYRINNDLEDRAGVHVLEVPLSSKAGFELTVNSLEAALALARRQSKKVRGMLLINPNNPLGDVYPESILIECLQFAFKHGLHVIVDEIYALSVFDESTKFCSILSLNMPDPQRVHFIWGVSKDLGLSGYRCGVLYTTNDQVLGFATRVGLFQLTPPLMQRRLEHVISDNDWLDKVYFPAYHTRLASVFTAACAKLAAMGVTVHPSKAGIFLWADFSPFLPEPTFAAEQRLFEYFIDARVYLMPGKKSYCPSPGWFRLVIASDKNRVLEGLHRIEQVLLSQPLKKQTSS